MHRFYAPPAQWTGERVVLDEAEGRHASEVMRLRAGDRICVFDGCGTEGEVLLSVAGRRGVEGVLEVRRTLAPPSLRLTLVQALPKGKLFEWILEKAVELGVSRVVPVLSERTVVQLDAAERERKQTKWERVAIEASKQCGRSFLPEVAAPVALSAFLRSEPARFGLTGSLHPGRRPLGEVVHAPLNGEVCVFVGPEGDFTGGEMEAMREWGALPVSLGPLVLRVETAALYFMSVLNHLGGEDQTGRA